MRIVRLAELLAFKYKTAADPIGLESSLRKKIGILWAVPNKSHNILRACAEAGASKAVTPEERKAVAGNLFCKQLLSQIDYLKSHESNISVGELREVLLSVVSLIAAHKNIKFNADGKPSAEGESSIVQFPHVSELIFQMSPSDTKHNRKLRDELPNKARTGLSRILSISMDMLNDLEKLEMMVPEKFTHKNITNIDINKDLPARFTPQRAMLAENDIIDFIRQYGNEYGISSTENWATVFMDDPQLKQEITTVINALNRGHSPKDAAMVKMQIAEILKNHEERKSSNAPLFEDSE